MLNGFVLYDVRSKKEKINKNQVKMGQQFPHKSDLSASPLLGYKCISIVHYR